VWNDKAFDNLVLPGGEKELAWEFVESKARSEETIDDFVPEKGKHDCAVRIWRFAADWTRTGHHHPHVRAAGCWQDIHCGSR